ncbi:hypothetical protein Z043_115728 [Scleropages formosus]|uniref:Uncharacterized protein n=1 Tax=Scleropages formosus TaxID=113540 RepID=A0A0N8JY84_SCLFO|nr:hypothetical protein Z043_115728 [Scleropages formosus]
MCLCPCPRPRLRSDRPPVSACQSAGGGVWERGAISSRPRTHAAVRPKQPRNSRKRIWFLSATQRVRTATESAACECPAPDWGGRRGRQSRRARRVTDTRDDRQ